MTKKHDLSPHEAAERFIQRRQSTNTDNTVRSYRGRLQEFTQWTHANDITSMDEFDGWLLDEYKAHLETGDNAPTTIKGKLNALKQLLQYCVTIEIVDEDLSEKISIPQLSREDETSDTLLAAEDAVRPIEYFPKLQAEIRDSPPRYARTHVAHRRSHQLLSRPRCPRLAPERSNARIPSPTTNEAQRRDPPRTQRPRQRAGGRCCFVLAGP